MLPRLHNMHGHRVATIHTWTSGGALVHERRRTSSTQQHRAEAEAAAPHQEHCWGASSGRQSYWADQSMLPAIASIFECNTVFTSSACPVTMQSTASITTTLPKMSTCSPEQPPPLRGGSGLGFVVCRKHRRVLTAYRRPDDIEHEAQCMDGVQQLQNGIVPQLQDAVRTTQPTYALPTTVQQNQSCVRSARQAGAMVQGRLVVHLCMRA